MNDKPCEICGCETGGKVGQHSCCLECFDAGVPAEWLVEDEPGNPAAEQAEYDENSQMTRDGGIE